jgi:tetratricopeptide (TPR) repeat protein
VDRPDVHYFLGWLYQEADRWDEAAGLFELLLEDPDYALSCYYALGQCSRAQGNIEQAARFFDEAVDRVNLDALTRDESDQLLQLCQEAAEAHREMNDLDGAETVYTALLGFLRSQGWADQVAEVERLMRETLGSAPPPQRRRKTADPSRPVGGNIPQRGRTRAPASSGPVGPAARSGRTDAPDPSLSSQMAAVSGALPDDGAGLDDADDLGVSANFGTDGPPVRAPYYSSEMPPATDGDQLAQLIRNLGTGPSGSRSGVSSLPEAQRAQVTAAVRDIENYVAHGLLTAAIEECLRVMEMAPQYLDVHLMLGEIYVRQGKIEQAIAKYAILIDTYLVNGRIDDAISTYRRILQLEPNNLTYRVKLIELLQRQGRIEEVLAERMSAADSYMRLGYADRAIQEFEQALLSSPNSAHIRLSYAAALMKAGRAQAAIAEYQRVLQVDSTNVVALTRWQIGLASGVGAGASLAASTPGTASPNRVAGLEVLSRLLRTLRSQGMRGYDDVVREYMQALDTQPASGDLRYALGQIYLAFNRQQEALTCFQQVSASPGLEVLGRYAAAQAYLLASDPTSASAAARELEEALAATKRVPPEPTIWAARPRMEGEEHLAPELEISTLLARAYQASGNVAQMQSTMQAVQQQRPSSSEVYQALAEVSARKGDAQTKLQEYAQLVQTYRANRQVENALTVLKEMARIAPDDPAVRSELADIHISRGLLDEGLAEMKQLADIHTRRGQLKDAALVYQRAAEINWGMENRDEALSQLRQAVQYVTDDMAMRQQFVQYCLEVGRTSEAIEQQTVIARFYFASRQTKEAVAALQQLIGMDQHQYEAYDLLGQTYYSVGEYEQAARVYRNLAKVDPSNQIARVRLQELQTVRSQMR